MKERAEVENEPDADKSRIFEGFYGRLGTAPMIREWVGLEYDPSRV